MDAYSDHVTHGYTVYNPLLASEHSMWHKIPVYVLHTDDVILLTSSQKGLQRALNIVSEYCKEKLMINHNKSNVMIFKKSFISSYSLFTVLGIKLRHM